MTFETTFVRATGIVTVLVALGACNDPNKPQVTNTATGTDMQPTNTATGTNTGTGIANEGAGSKNEIDDDNDDDDKNEAEAEFKSAEGMDIEGEAKLTQATEGVRIEVSLENAPAGEKGLHIHETDDCSDIPNKSMGGHFSPDGAEHGLPTADKHHLGDLGNITIGPDGKGKLSITVPKASLAKSDKMSFIGKSIVLHESNDKGTGDSGDAGKPIACAPIEAD